MSVRNLIGKFAGFSVVGTVVTLVSMGLLFVFNEGLRWNVYLSYAAAYLLSIQLSYVLNLRYVFRRRFGWRTLWQYNLTYVGGMLLGLVLVRLYTWLAPECNRTVLSYAAIPFTMLFNFFFVNRITKTKTHEESDR